MTHDQQTIAYISKRIATYKDRANRTHDQAQADRYREVALAFGVLIGDIEAGLHVPDETVAV